MSPASDSEPHAASTSASTLEAREQADGAPHPSPGAGGGNGRGSAARLWKGLRHGQPVKRGCPHETATRPEKFLNQEARVTDRCVLDATAVSVHEEIEAVSRVGSGG